MRFFVALALLAACDGGGATGPATVDAAPLPDGPAPIVCRGQADSDTVVVTAVTSVPFDATVGQLSGPITVRVHDQNDVAITGCTVAWGVPNNDGWLFPLSPLTDETGVAQAWWVQGTDPSQVATAMIWTRDSWSISDLTAIVSSAPTRATALSATFAAGAYDAIAFRVTPTAAPADTTIAVEWGGTQIALVDVAGAHSLAITTSAGTTSAPLAWQVGTPYDVAFAYDGTYHLTVDGEALGSVDGAAPTSGNLAAYVRDDGAAASTCLATATRSAAFSNLSGTIDGVATPLTSADLATSADAIDCGNVQGDVEDGAFVLSTGGSAVGDPAVTHLAL